MDGYGSGLSGRSPRLEGRMPGHRISGALVLHRDVVPTAAFVERGQPASPDHGVRTTRRRLPPQTAGRLHPRLRVKGPTQARLGTKSLQPGRTVSDVCSGVILVQSFLWKMGRCLSVSTPTPHPPGLLES